ncbi:MAG: transporter substrate-binding domain-containing protein, partial [Candidatus Fermentibacteria bacterium]
MRFVLQSCILVCTSVAAFAGIIRLSPEENQYLTDHPEIHFVSQTSYPPFEFIDDNGEHQGMCIELIRWISTEIGFQAVFSDMSFQEAQEAVLNGDADVLTSFFYSAARDSFFEFSVPMFEIPARIFVRSETTDILTLADLSQKTVAVQRGDYAIDFLESEHINCTLIYADNFSDATQLLRDGEADALIGDEQIIEYSLFNQNLSEDVVATGDTLYIGQDCMAVVEGNRILCSIISKGIEHAIESGIVKGIELKWQDNPIVLSAYFRYKTHLLIISGVILIAAILVFLWNLRLRHIVERKTRSLFESEMRLNQALAQANLGSWEFNMITREVLNNDHYFIMLGYSPGEQDFSYNGWLNQVHPDDREFLESYIAEYLSKDSGRFECEYRMKTKEGEWISIHSCGGIVDRDYEGKPVRIAGIHQNVTRRNQSEYLARKAAEDWENTFDALPELIAVLDSAGIIIRVNRAQALALGMTREECIGKNLCTLIYLEDDCLPPIFSREKTPFLLREMHLEKLGGEFEVSIVTSEDPEDGSTRVLHVLRDITERKSAEEKQREMERRVQHMQKLESLGVLAGGIAHDFNNFLMAIQGYTDLAASVNEEEKVHQYLDEINKSVGLASELTGQMLAYSGKGN